MAADSQIPSRWTLVDVDPQQRPATLQSNHLVSPIRRCEGLSPLLCGLAPNRDHNAELSRCLASMPEQSRAHSPLFAVFAADPFIAGSGLVGALQAKGYKRIVNWPTTAQYGAEFAATLGSVNLGIEQESKTLRRFAESGLKVSVAVSLPESVTAFAELEPEIFFVAPGFDLWKKSGRFDQPKLLRRCAAIAQAVAGRAPVILMADAVSMHQAKEAGASGLLIA
jgi:predicted TIM-barrel enzyme